MGSIDLARLTKACGDDGAAGGIMIRTDLLPLAGPNAKIKPATYAGGEFQRGHRWWGEGSNRRVVDTITIDNEPSQANRLEFVLEQLRAEFGFPEFILDLSMLEPLPPHVPRALSSFRFPHRNADAYLRDSQLDGKDLMETDIGRAVFDATVDRADALLQWFPQALIYGFWQSHLGKKGSQAKLARSWVSEIVGIEPATTENVRVLGLKGDPLNLSIAEKVSVGDDRQEQWELGTTGKKKLSDIGHGQVPFGGDADRAMLAGVSFREIAQQTTVSFASLRRIYPVDEEAAAPARALLVAMGLLAHVTAFGRAFNLRSGCDLRPASSEWIWLSEDGDESLEPPDVEDVGRLLREAVTQAEDAGLPVGSRWRDSVVLTPKKNLKDAIRSTFPVPEE